MRNERNRRVFEYQQQIEKERETFKQRLYDSEKKAKETESKRANLLFAVEKERANWVLEEDQLKRKVQELEELNQSLETNKESLKKEIERLRQELRGGPGGNPARKQFLFAKPAAGQGSPMLGSTQNTSTSGASKYLLNKSGNLQSNISSAVSNAGAFNSNGGSNPITKQTNTANNIINAAISRLKDSKL